LRHSEDEDIAEAAGVAILECSAFDGDEDDDWDDEGDEEPFPGTIH